MPKFPKLPNTAHTSRGSLSPDGEVDPARCDQRPVSIGVGVLGPAGHQSHDLDSAIVKHMDTVRLSGCDDVAAERQEQLRGLAHATGQPAALMDP